jgi:hypothetical protein
LYPAIYIAYRQILAQKRLEVNSVLGPGRHQTGPELGALYEKVFGVAPDVLFKKSFSTLAYSLPNAINEGMTFVLGEIALQRVGIRLPVSAEVTTALSSVSGPVIAGMAGAFVWGLYDALRRYRVGNLSPTDLHFNWLRMIVAALLGALVTPVFASSFACCGLRVGCLSVEDLEHRRVRNSEEEY